jgi:hypothetical protein
LEFGSAEPGGATLAELAALLAGRADDFGALPGGRAELVVPERLTPGATDRGEASRGATSAVLGAAAEGRPSSGATACCGALGRMANATINARSTANRAAPSTQLSGTAARCGSIRSLTGGTLSRARSTKIVTAGELLRLARKLRSLGGATGGGAEARKSVEGCGLRLANGSRNVDTLRRSKPSS